MGKLSLLVGLGAGYVLGAMAGRRRYEQIRTRTNQLWGHPKVRQSRTALGREVRSRAPQVAAAAGSAAIRAAGQAIMAHPPADQAPSSAGDRIPVEARHTEHTGSADRTIPRHLA